MKSGKKGFGGMVMKTYIIAIAREFGSGGKEIGFKLSERLGIPCYEQYILKMASEATGIEEEYFNKTDEKLRGNYLIKFLQGEPSPYLVSPSDKDFISDVNLFNIQAKIISDLSETQSCIIVGKCADYVLRDKENVLSVFVTASLKSMVESVMKKMQVDEKEAERLVKRTNKYREDYYKYYTQRKEWKSPNYFDMVLNSEKLGRETCADIIESVARKRFF